MLFLLVPAAACSKSPTTPTTTTSSGPYWQTDLVVGTGTTAVSTSRVTVSYTGWLYDPTKSDLKGLQLGGQRRLIVPPDLAYGSSGSGPIPANATLVFDIGLIAVQ